MSRAKPLKCTVLVPSFKRLSSVLELLVRLRRQDYPDFEVLIIEQTPDPEPELMAKLERIAQEDPRVRFERHPPLRVGGARNAGMASAKGDVVLIIDDDDLPATDAWISQHMVNYDDPKCIACHGSEKRVEGGAGGLERRFPRLAHHLAMSYLPWGTPIALPATRDRKEGVSYLRGGNSSIRRERALRAGGWVDECTNGQEEHDFSFRLRKTMSPEEYIVYDPSARMTRRMGIPGGADRRTGTLARDVEGNVWFYYRVLGRHRPMRTALLAPVYPWILFTRAVGWVVDDRAHEPLPAKVAALAHIVATFPLVLGRGYVRLLAPRPAPKGKERWPSLGYE